YKLRADDYHKKQSTLAALRKKALDKNPDEFYFNMVSSQLKDGVHVANKAKGTEEENTEEQRKKNGHTFYVDSKHKVYSRPTLHTLESKTIQGAVEPLCIKKLAKQRKHPYKILSQRIDREKMFVIGQKIQTRKDLHDKNKKVKVSKETVNASAVYKFEAKRKR
uniref:Probable U3 small nucleolar RNA-associated protein 11 n=1 Tax=Hucho hucho TaxID=62062 RepID=A0A4W5MNX8_9TELE